MPGSPATPWTGSFIHAGGDHGEASSLSSRPRRRTAACAAWIMGTMPFSTSRVTFASKCCSPTSPSVSSKLYDAGVKSHELIGTRPIVYPSPPASGASKYRWMSSAWSAGVSERQLIAAAAVNAPPNPSKVWWRVPRSTTTPFSPAPSSDPIERGAMSRSSTREPSLFRAVCVHSTRTHAQPAASSAQPARIISLASAKVT